MSESALQRFASGACREVGLEGAVTILISNNREIQALNGRFRKKGRPTDVLSFPAPVFAPDFAGDIAISLDIATQNARALGHSVATELRILILHGVLHLAGYDHESDGGQMARKEVTIRRRLLLPTSLIERTEHNALAHNGKRPRARSRV